MMMAVVVAVVLIVVTIMVNRTRREGWKRYR